MQTYNDQDGKFQLLKKILQNQSLAQTELIAAINAMSEDPVVGSDPVTGTDIICDTAGVAKQGVASPSPDGVLVSGRAGNTGTVYIGGPTVTNASGSRQGLPLFQGGMTPIRYPASDVSKIFVNADTNGDGVSIIIL